MLILISIVIQIKGIYEYVNLENHSKNYPLECGMIRSSTIFSLRIITVKKKEFNNFPHFVGNFSKRSKYLRLHTIKSMNIYKAIMTIHTTPVYIGLLWV